MYFTQKKKIEWISGETFAAIKTNVRLTDLSRVA